MRWLVVLPLVPTLYLAMFSIFSSQLASVKLDLESRVYLVGETVVGCVELDIRGAQEERIAKISVSLQGAINTRITHRVQRVHHPHTAPTSSDRNASVDETSAKDQEETVILKANVPLISITKKLWDNFYSGDSEAFSEKALRLPFKFILPENLPPSFNAGSRDNCIRYTIEVTVERDGWFSMNKRIEQELSVTSRATRQEMIHISELQLGWEDSWAVVSKDEAIRKFFWHSQSRAEVHLSLPAVHTLPVGTPIPMRLRIVTFTPIMNREDTPEDAFSSTNDNQLYPVPPKEPSKIQFMLRSQTILSAQGVSQEIFREEGALCAFGNHPSLDAIAHLRRTISEPQWIPNNEVEGCWRRAVQFESRFTLKCPPTIETSIIQRRYELDVNVPFPGLGNDIKIKLPVKVNSGMNPTFDMENLAVQTEPPPYQMFSGTSSNTTI